jgi:hypothetical protein
MTRNRQETSRLSLIALLAAALAACGSPHTRIKKNQQLFDTYPSSTQELIRAGQVEVGFTMEQTRMALGRPDRITEVVLRARTECGRACQAACLLRLESKTSGGGPHRG